MNHRFEYALLLILRQAILVLPVRGVQHLGAALGSVAYRLWKSRREIALDNLRRAFPEETEERLRRIARGAFRNYGIAICELLWFPRLSDRELAKLVNLTNIEVLEDEINRGRGLILLTGHFGNWELIAFATGAMRGLTMKIIARTQRNAPANTLINKHRMLRGNVIVQAGISVREIIRSLNNHGIVAMAPDQSGPMEGPRVMYFGRRVPTHQGPAVFSLRTGAPIVMGFMLRQPNGSYNVVFETVQSTDLQSDSEENVVELTQRYTTLLESYVRRYPDHWLWMHRRWKHADAVAREASNPASG